MRVLNIYLQFIRVFWVVGVIIISAGAAGCAAAGPSEAEVQQIVDARVATAIAEIPMVTPAPIIATATPVTFPNIPTPAPTATPQPTPTPIRFPSTATPQPTTTPQPTATPQPLSTEFSDVFAEYVHGVFRIETSSGMGTGWLIEPGLILTNQHVVEGSTIVSVRQNQQSLFTARVRAVDEPRDIALLSFDVSQTFLDPMAKPLPTGLVYTSDIASSMMAMGYSGGLTPLEDGTIGPATANIGVLSGIVIFTFHDVTNLVIDAVVDPGDSGGPVFSLDGEVVGMTRAAHVSSGSGERVVGTFYAVEWGAIRDALPNLKRGISR
jgi:S1-C subfamily serine protease